MATDINLVRGMADAIEKLLADERWPAPDFCSVCLLGFGRVIGNNAPSIPIVQTQYHGFLDTCMRYLTIPCTAREKQVLSKQLQHNIDHCQLINGDYQSHDDRVRGWEHTHIDDAREMMQSLLCHILYTCLCGFDRTSDSHSARSPVAKALNPHKPFGSVTGCWPTKINQLFPFGPEHTIEAVVEACCFFASRTPFSVLCAILELARPHVWDAVLHPNNHHRLVWAISATLLLGIPGGDVQLGLYSDVTPPGCKIPAVSVRGGNYAHPDDVLRFACPYAHFLVPVLSFAMAHYQSTERAACGTFEYYTAALKRAAEVETLTPVLSEADLAHFAAAEPRHLVMLRMIRGAMNWLLKERHCAGPGCARTMPDTGKPLSMCARCRLTRYCAKGCQRGDWKSGTPVPHKLLCDALAKLRAFDRPDTMKDDEYTLFVEQTGIPDETLALLGRWALSRGQIMQHHLCVVIHTAPQSA
ncbi:hypothetical protein AURDEDRAFT_173815 [Auricularia subglabra TFB-10046 SS5]|nr:hypothetical protein AURDEDRAFT_173815 [Auricularia subglabra TFB-10046 SS5]